MALAIVQSRRILKESWELLPKKLLVQMLRNQVIVYDMSFSNIKEDTLARWCQENCNGLFRISELRVYFEEESDMVAFKVYWHGKEKED